MPVDPFRLDAAAAPWPARLAVVAARPLLSWALQLPLYRRLYAHSQTLSAPTFVERALETLHIRPVASPGDLERIPRSGPLIVAANHPHGLVDGLVLASLVARVRPDARLLVNRFLDRIPELGPLCFFVDVFGRPGAAARSRAGLRAAHAWLENGGALIAFPSGEVAHERRPAADDRRGEGHAALARYRDSPWTPTVGRLAIATRAQLVPAYIDGTNSRLFYAAGRVHPALRTVLLPRECLKQRDRSITVRVAPALAANHDRADDLIAAVRAAVDALAPPPGTGLTMPAAAFTRHDSIAVEIARLPSDRCLVESSAFQVFYADARQIPVTLREIGRLREVTYRAIGEGTGQPVDLDAFDERYLHLFLWDRERRRIAGAYRIGQADELVRDGGVEALYTRTLFVYDERLIARLSPALELGRSFVAAEYQRHSNALLWLWKGIGRFLVRHPKYRVLFGPVSISTHYSDRSHQLLMAFLSQNHRHEALSELVAAINPKSLNPPPATALPQSIDEANWRVSQLESDGKGVPVLLRQYLRLNARLLGFNVDPQFGDALDALMMVDLTQVDAAILARYLGREGARQFLAHHTAPPAAA